jgi:hypothetical protein
MLTPYTGKINIDFGFFLETKLQDSSSNIVLTSEIRTSVMSILLMTEKKLLVSSDMIFVAETGVIGALAAVTGMTNNNSMSVIKHY